MCCHVSPARNACCGSGGQLAKRMAKRWLSPCTSCRNTRSASSERRPSRRSCSTMRRLNCDSPLWMLSVTTLRLCVMGSAGQALGGGPDATSYRRASRVPRPSALSQQVNGIAVRPREAPRRRLAPGQPLESEVLRGREAHRAAPRQLQRERVLDVVRHARPEAVAPLLPDLERVGDVAALEASGPRLDAGLLRHLAQRGSLERLVQ